MRLRFLALLFAIAAAFSATRLCGQTLRFAQISDTHIRNSHPTIDDLRQTVSQINNLDSISFVILTGDITHKGDSLSMAITKSILDNLTMPYYIIPGNHDTKFDTSSINYFRHIFGNTHFSFIYGKYMFVGINTGQYGTSEGHVEKAELIWLDSILQNTDSAKLTILFTHHPIQQGDIDNHMEVQQVVSNRINYVLCGHYHLNMILNCDDMPCITTRTNQSSNNQQSGFSVVSISEDTISWTEYNPDLSTNEWLQMPLINQ